MLVRRWVLLCVAAQAHSLALPPSCRHTRGDESVIQCQAESTILIDNKKWLSPKVTCEGSNITCGSLPRLDVAHRRVLDTLELTACHPNITACVLQAVNATGAWGVKLVHPRAALEPRHVAGLDGLMYLSLVGDGNALNVPARAMEMLPGLYTLIVTNASLQLTNGMFQHSASNHMRLLRFYNNNIGEVPDEAFRGLKSLMYLDLYDDKIERISKQAFKGLVLLGELDLSNNNVQVLQPGLFAPLSELKRVHCDNNTLDMLNEGVFTGQKLRQITINYNRANLKIGRRAFANLSSLHTLTMSNSSIVEIAHDFIEGTFLANLNLSHNEISELPSNMLRKQTKLEDLDLSFNKISSLPERAFFQLVQLRNLNLNNNFIQVLPSNLFSIYTDLQTVSIDNNQLHTISDDAFIGITVDTLSMNGNHLTLQGYDSSRLSPFQDMRVDYLLLANNSISHIIDDWKSIHKSNIKKLDLSGNNISELTDTDFQFDRRGVLVDLRRNKISSISVNISTEARQTSRDLAWSHSSIFFLDENPFHCDCKLYPVKKLQYIGFFLLRLENVKCATPPNMKGRLFKNVSPKELTCDLQSPDCPESCSCTEQLHDKIIEIVCVKMPTEWPNKIKGTKIHLKLSSPDVKNVPPILTSLDLSNTSLKNVKFTFTSKLKKLDLTNNKLTKIPINVLNSSLSLYLANNPFECGCWNKRDIQTLENFQNKFDKVIDYQNVTCVSGNQIGIDVENLCNTQNLVMTVSVSIILFLLPIIVCVLIYHYSNEILVFIIRNGYCSCLFSAEYIDTDKEYDIFVSFAHQDELFVVDQLIPKLENEFKQKVCVHFRDWVVGELIPMQIVRSVEQSRRTVIVLSTNFLSSMWANLEFRAAHTLALKEGRARVVLIILEDEVLTDGRLSDELRAYMSTNTYLKSNDARFWERLRKALPSRDQEFKVINNIWRRRATPNTAENPASAGLSVQLDNESNLVNDTSE